MDQYPDKPAFQKFFDFWRNDRNVEARLVAPNKKISLFWESGEFEEFIFTTPEVTKQIYKEVVIDKIFGVQR
jgi:hypothetical protein